MKAITAIVIGMLAFGLVSLNFNDQVQAQDNDNFELPVLSNQETDIAQDGAFRLLGGEGTVIFNENLSDGIGFVFSDRFLHTDADDASQSFRDNFEITSVLKAGYKNEGDNEIEYRIFESGAMGLSLIHISEPTRPY